MFHGLLLMYLCFPHSLSFPASGILSDGYDTTGQGDGLWGNFRWEIGPAPPRRAIVGVQSGLPPPRRAIVGVQSDESRQRGHFASVQSDESRQRGHFASVQSDESGQRGHFASVQSDKSRQRGHFADAQRPAHPLEARLQTCNDPCTPWEPDCRRAISRAPPGSQIADVQFASHPPQNSVARREDLPCDTIFVGCAEFT